VILLSKNDDLTPEAAKTGQLYIQGRGLLAVSAAMMTWIWLYWLAC
jgi:hypothetical protein